MVCVELVERCARLLVLVMLWICLLSTLFTYSLHSQQYRRPFALAAAEARAGVDESVK